MIELTVEEGFGRDQGDAKGEHEAQTKDVHAAAQIHLLVVGVCLSGCDALHSHWGRHTSLCLLPADRDFPSVTPGTAHGASRVAGEHTHTSRFHSLKRLDTFGVCKIPLTTYSIHIMDQENTNFNRWYSVNF
jgi:hypothetical protein